MSKDKTYNAFTLVEMLVALVISMLVIGMAYTAFLFLTGRFTHQKNISESLTSIYRLKDLIEQDYSKAQDAQIDDDELVLSYVDATIVYSADSKNGYVLRNLGEQTDTFYVSNDGFQPIDSNTGGKVLSLNFASKQIPILLRQKQSITQKIRSKYED